MVGRCHRAFAQNDDTQEGWRRDGWWEKTGAVWEKGRCQPWFNRTCRTPHKQLDLRTHEIHYVDNTDSAFRPRYGCVCVADTWTPLAVRTLFVSRRVRGCWLVVVGQCELRHLARVQ